MMQRADTRIPGVGEEEEAARERLPTTLGRNPRVRWLLAGVSVLAILAILSAWRYYAVRETTDDAQIDGHIHPVSAKASGTVARVHVVNNQRVEAGTVLVEIDPQDYQVALERAKADLAEAEAKWHADETEVPITSEMATSRLSDAEARVEGGRAGLSATQKDAEAARAGLRSAQARQQEASANSQKAAQDLERMKRLLAEGVVSQQQYEAAVAAAEALRAALDAATAAVTTAELGIPAAESRVVQEQAKLAQAEAAVKAARTAPQQVRVAQTQAQSSRASLERARTALQQAQLNLEYAVVKAPVGGLISKKAVEIGQIVQLGQPLMAIVALDDVWITANFKETQLRNMRPGQKVVISVDAYGGRKYDGHVESIAAATESKFSLLPPQNASGNFVKVVQRIPVKIVLEKGQDSEHLLRPGMSVVPTVSTP